MSNITPFEKFKDNAVFIMGYPKSGTTLMASLLDYHPQLVVFSEELKFFQRIIGPNFYKNLSKQEKKDILLHFCLRKFKESRYSQAGTGNRDYSHVDFDYFINDIFKQIDRTNSDKEILLSVINSFYKIIDKSDKSNKKRWVEKTPYNNFYFPIFKKWFGDNVICLHMIRDPYDNFASYRRKLFPKLTIERFCLDWLYQKELIKLAKKHIKKYYVIKYEDLVQDPERVLRKVCGWLEIDFDKSMLKPTFLGKRWYGNSAHGNKFHTISPKSIGIHKQLLKKEEIEKIDSLINKFNFNLRVKLFKRLMLFRLRWLCPKLYKLILRIYYYARNKKMPIMQ